MITNKPVMRVWFSTAAFTVEVIMKRFMIVLSLFAVFFLTERALAIDKATISTNVDIIVTGIESGKDVKTYKADTYDPYAFIMKEDGKMLVHPSLAGESLKEKALPVYTALLQATQDGVWLEYEWQGKIKHTYAKKTNNNLIVGSGY
jgi:hypothetical protein